MRKAFAHTAAYDMTIAATMRTVEADGRAMHAPRARR